MCLHARYRCLVVPSRRCCQQKENKNFKNDEITNRLTAAEIVMERDKWVSNLMGREKQFFCWLANKLFKLQVLKGILKGKKRVRAKKRMIKWTNNSFWAVSGRWGSNILVFSVKRWRNYLVNWTISCGLHTKYSLFKLVVFENCPNSKFKK